MTTEAEAIETVSAYVKSRWEAASFSLPVPGSASPITTPPDLILGNETFAQPSNGATWAFARVRATGSKQKTMGPVGSRKFERSAVLEWQINVPAGVGGAAPMARVRDVIRTLVEGVQLSGLRPFLSERVRRETNDGRMSVAVVEFPFSFIETK